MYIEMHLNIHHLYLTLMGLLAVRCRHLHEPASGGSIGERVKRGDGSLDVISSRWGYGASRWIERGCYGGFEAFVRRRLFRSYLGTPA